jgi:simple sugar transport system ATP-binding protein
MDVCELEFSNVTKRFGETLANDHVSFAVKKGEVHALVGENGAGKSTCMNILYGMLRPDAGEIIYHGSPVFMRSPRDAISLGVGMVHQHFMLSPSLSVAENIVLGYALPGKKIWKLEELRKKIEFLQQDFDIHVPLNVPVKDLTVGLMQRVEIVKTLYRGAQIIILDEPTAVLTPQESDELFNTIQKLTRRGYTIIFISHKLREVTKIANCITVLRAGKCVGTVNTVDVTRSQIAKMMIGREMTGLGKKVAHIGDVVLEVKDLVVAGDRGA